MILDLPVLIAFAVALLLLAGGTMLVIYFVLSWVLDRRRLRRPPRTNGGRMSPGSDGPGRPTAAQDEEQRIRRLQHDRERLQAQIAEHRGSVAKLQREVSRLRDQAVRLREEQAQAEAVRTEHRRLSNELSTLRLEIRKEQEQLAPLQLRREQLQSGIARMESRTDELLQSLEPLQAEAQQRQDTLADLRLESRNLQARIRQREARLAELEEGKAEAERLISKLEATRGAISDEERRCNALGARREQLEAQVHRGEERAKELQTLLQPLELQVQQHTEAAAGLRREAISLQRKIQYRQTRVAELDAERESAKEEQAGLTTRLGETKAQVVSERERLDRLEEERAQLQDEVSDLRDRVHRATEDLVRLHAERRRPLWQAILRADLDANERTPLAEEVLARLKRADPDGAIALQLEIDARTGSVDLPPGTPEALSGQPRLFASVIEARAAQNAGGFTKAVETLCDGWEALLPADSTAAPGAEPSDQPAAPLASPSSRWLPLASSSVVSTAAPREPPSAIRPADPVQTAAPTPTNEVRREKSIAQPTCSSVRVTGQWSTVQIEGGDAQILVDPGPDYTIADEPPLLVVVTHAHNDHVDQLVPLCERFPDVPVVMTPETCDLLGLVRGGWRTIRDRQVYCLQPHEVRRIEGVDIQLQPAGHLLGAAMADLSLDGRRILVTGDFSLRSVGGLPQAEIPEYPYDLVLMEAVHASDHDFPSSDSQRNRQQQLVERVVRAAEDGYTRLLIAAAAMGDAQEVYDALLTGQRDPVSSALARFAVCLKGMAHSVARLYAQAGVWNHAVPDECLDPVEQQTIIVASEGAANTLRQQFEPIERAVVFEPQNSPPSTLAGGRYHHYCVDLHASLEELIELGQHVRCDVIGLYHGDASGSPLESKLRSGGKRVVNVTAAERLQIDLDGD